MSTLHRPAEAPRAQATTLAATTAPATSERTTLRSHGAERAERRAWLLIWLAFATFSALVASGLKLSTDFVATAEVPRSARVERSRGTVFFRAPSGPEARLTSMDRELPAGTVVEAPRTLGGTASLRLFDGTQVEVLPGAQLDLLRMDVGRFINRQSLVLGQSSGPVRYLAASELQVAVPNGSVQLGRGDVTVWVEGERTRVLVYQGEARLENETGSVVVQAGQRSEIASDRRILAATQRSEELLSNGDFTARRDGWTEIDVQEGPRDVDGERQFVQASIGSTLVPALRIVRDSQTFAHGETGLRQTLDADVTGFRRLFVEAWVRVDRASLSGGGQLGSEYPMMLRVVYQGKEEDSRWDWLQGFYVQNPENRPVRNAEQVPQSEWVHFGPRDLMQTDESRKPYRLLRFEVMGQGHTYDAQVAQVRLYGD